MTELPSKFVHFFLLSRYRRTLSRLLDNELSAAQAAAARTHLDECTDCQREYEELRFVKDAVLNLEDMGRGPTYTEFQARALKLQPVETHSIRSNRSIPTLHLRFAAYVLAVGVFSFLSFLIGISYANNADAVPPIDVAEQRSNSLPLHLLTAPATTPLEITAKNINTSSPRPPHLHTPDTSQLWEKIAQNQAVNLQNSPEPKRGDLEQLKNDEPPLLIVMSKAHHTGIRLELPQDCEKGKYLLSLERLDGKPLPITAEEESRDGAALNVSLDLRGLAAGKYLLLVERQNEDQREYIGHFTVRMVDPGSSAK